MPDVLSDVVQVSHSELSVDEVLSLLANRIHDIVLKSTVNVNRPVLQIISAVDIARVFCRRNPWHSKVLEGGSCLSVPRHGVVENTVGIALE